MPSFNSTHTLFLSLSVFKELSKEEKIRRARSVKRILEDHLQLDLQTTTSESPHSSSKSSRSTSAVLVPSSSHLALLPLETLLLYFNLIVVMPNKTIFRYKTLMQLLLFYYSHATIHKYKTYSHTHKNNKHF